MLRLGSPLLVLSALVALPGVASATTTSFTTPGPHSFQVPANVNQITVAATGGGGGADNFSGCTPGAGDGEQGTFSVATKRGFHTLKRRLRVRPAPAPRFTG